MIDFQIGHTGCRSSYRRWNGSWGNTPPGRRAGPAGSCIKLRESDPELIPMNRPKKQVSRMMREFSASNARTAVGLSDGGSLSTIVAEDFQEADLDSVQQLLKGLKISNSLHQSLASLIPSSRFHAFSFICMYFHISPLFYFHSIFILIFNACPD